MLILNCGKCRKDTKATPEDLKKSNLKCECGNYLIKDGNVRLANY